MGSSGIEDNDVDHNSSSSSHHRRSLQQPEIKPWDPNVASDQEFPITTYQPVYFCASSLNDAKKLMREYCENLPRPFFAQYNGQNNTIHIDRPIKRTINIPPQVAVLSEDNNNSDGGDEVC